MLKEIHVVLGAGQGPANEVFIETEDQDGRGIGDDHGLRSEKKPYGRDIIIDMVQPIRDFLQEAKRDMAGQESGSPRTIIDNLLQRLEAEAG